MVYLSPSTSHSPTLLRFSDFLADPPPGRNSSWDHSSTSWHLRASWPGPALSCVCTGVAWFTNKQDKNGKNPLLWRIRSVAGLGRGGTQTFSSLPSFSSLHLPEATGAEVRRWCWEQTSGHGGGQAVRGTCSQRGRNVHVKACCEPLPGAPPAYTLDVFAWITWEGY